MGPVKDEQVPGEGRKDVGTKKKKKGTRKQRVSFFTKLSRGPH